MLIRQRQGVEIATEKPEFQHKKCQSIAKTHNVFYFSEDCISLTVFFFFWSNQMNASSKYIINNVGNVHCVSSQNAIFVFSRRRHHDGTSIICHTMKCSCSKQLRALAQRSEEICRQLIGKIGRETCHVTRVFFSLSSFAHLLISSFLLSTPCSALAAGILLLIMVLLIWPILVTCVTITLATPYLRLFIYLFIIYFLLVWLFFVRALLVIAITEMWIGFYQQIATWFYFNDWINV